MASSATSEPLSPRSKLFKSFTISKVELFKDKEYLHQKYIVERLSSQQIADDCGCARSSVLKYLEVNGISKRPTGSNIRRKRGLAFGKRISKGQIIDHKSELRILNQILLLRNKGYSYWKMAEVLNTMKIPTKTKKGSWHAKTIQFILSNKS